MGLFGGIAKGINERINERSQELITQQLKRNADMARRFENIAANADDPNVAMEAMQRSAYWSALMPGEKPKKGMESIDFEGIKEKQNAKMAGGVGGGPGGGMGQPQPIATGQPGTAGGSAGGRGGSPRAEDVSSMVGQQLMSLFRQMGGGDYQSEGTDAGAGAPQLAPPPSPDAQPAPSQPMTTQAGAGVAPPPVGLMPVDQPVAPQPSAPSGAPVSAPRTGMNPAMTGMVGGFPIGGQTPVPSPIATAVPDFDAMELPAPQYDALGRETQDSLLRRELAKKFYSEQFESKFGGGPNRGVRQWKQGVVIDADGYPKSVGVTFDPALPPGQNMIGSDGQPIDQSRFLPDTRIIQHGHQKFITDITGTQVIAGPFDVPYLASEDVTNPITLETETQGKGYGGEGGRFPAARPVLDPLPGVGRVEYLR